MASIDDVARHAGVSTATVSRVLNNKNTVSARTTARVLQAVTALEYVMSSSASSLASGRTKNIGVVVPALSRWYFTNVVEGVESALIRHGYDLTLYSLNDGGPARRSVFEHFLLRQRVDAVIAVSLELTTDELTRLHALNKPLVGVGGPLPGVRTLSIDDVEVSRLATQHLIDLGHRRIAHIGGTDEFEADFHLPANRREGFESALTAAGLPVRDEFFGTADFTIQGGHAAAAKLFSEHPPTDPDGPTAVFVTSDEMAIGCLLAAREVGLNVPDDVSIVGIDNHELARFFDLTTVAQYPRDQGRKAVEMLMDVLQPEQWRHGELNTPLDTTLIIRGSTAPPTTHR
ncbi:substrate-binding domain-containing protein [Klugiella xanthotipulae]|uniref:LacI family DNA-binding transcriptional regulator n=1 Tax=Klugiella xanthotipulae TaxID=244735 RepID=UPI00114FFF48|nr:LacI family DNA-binding transcriptional regulator [Klugiella xanthotipulae]